MPLKYATGREPHSPQQIASLRERHAYCGAAATVETVVQPIARIRDQKATPSCVGQACAAAVHALSGFDGSAIDLWTDARRRQGDLSDPSSGTTAELAIESLIHRGLDPYESGEEDRTKAELSKMPTLANEIEADDMRISPIAKRYLVVGTVAKQRLAIVEALKSGHAVLWATGVKDSFFNLGFDEIANSNHIGADDNGHEMRIVGYDAITDEYLVQNSWSGSWGGCTFQGDEYPGCFRVRAVDALNGAWDTMILELKRAS